MPSLERSSLPEHIITGQIIPGVSIEIPTETEVLIPFAELGTWNNGSPSLENDNTFVIPPDAQGHSFSLFEIQAVADTNATVTITIKLVVQGMTIASFPIPATAAGLQRDLLFVFSSKAVVITRPFTFELQVWASHDSGGSLELEAVGGRTSYELVGVG